MLNCGGDAVVAATVAKEPEEIVIFEQSNEEWMRKRTGPALIHQRGYVLPLERITYKDGTTSFTPASGIAFHRGH